MAVQAVTPHKVPTNDLICLVLCCERELVQTKQASLWRCRASEGRGRHTNGAKKVLGDHLRALTASPEPLAQRL